jgi:polysaccharide biosynthesis protein PslG
MRTGIQLRRVVLLVLAVVLLVVVAPATARKRVSSATKGPNPFVGVVSDETFAALGSGTPSYLNNIASAHVGLLRQKFDWDFLTHNAQDGGINWIFLDRFMTATTQQGITVMPVLFDPPASITTAPQVNPLRGNYPPQDLGAIGDFGAKLAARYGTNGSFWAQNPQLPKHPITAWQIWNEPNIPVYWQPGPNPARYVQMLQLASQKIKAVEPNAEIVTAGIPDTHIGGSIPLLNYLRAMYRAGAAGAFDTLAVNGYAPTGKDVVKLITHIRSVMNKYGGSGEALRVTEFGWADRGPEVKKGRFTVGAKKQAAYTSQAIQGLWKARFKLNLRGIVYYAWRDESVYAGGKDFWGLHTGLLTLNGQPKPALTSFQNTVASLH